MTKLKKYPVSLKWGLTLATLLCWILPIIIVSGVAGMLLSHNYNNSVKQGVDAETEIAMRQVEIRMLSVVEDCKAVSYDGVVRNAYREYTRNDVKFFLYRDVTEYLSQKFTRSAYYRAAFVSFLDEELDIHPYAAAVGAPRMHLLRQYSSRVLPAARELLAQRDTGIFFMVLDGEVYMVRNMLDSQFDPYAILIIELEKGELFRSLSDITNVRESEISLDGVTIPMTLRADESPDEALVSDVVYSTSVDGHSLSFTATVNYVSLWRSVPLLRWAILFIVLLVFPLLLLIIWLFYKNLNHPIEVLIEANNQVRDGHRGFTIQEKAPNSEFTQLYDHFNTMSSELESQFNRLYMEQQALQEAKIKALQSQINPHFLNNTLEIINWEARLADNERVCSMIEALSTMLDAAIGRDGRSRVTLAEEMKYVDAYLYITQERLGDRLRVTREIDPELEDCLVPLLMFQPIIENAVEYDLSRAGGELIVRAYAEAGDQAMLCFEVEHDGVISEEGQRNISRALQEPLTSHPEKLRSSSVGIRNVNQRLKLIYGDRASFFIRQNAPGKVLARIVLPGNS